MQIVNIFYELARTHNKIKGFAYGPRQDQGAGNDFYPLVWVDDPLTGRNAGGERFRVLNYTVNVDFLGMPANESEVLAVQAQAYKVGLSFAERLRETRAATGFSVDGFSFVSLRRYYDDLAAGYRFTFNLIQANPVELCVDDFDPGKTLGSINSLPDFKTDDATGCAVFSDYKGLPDFKL